MVFPIAGGNESKGYEISNSLRFNDDDSPNLTVAQSTPTDGSRWTWSGWVKRGNLSDGSNQETFASSYNGTNTDRIQFTEDDELHVEFKNGASTVLELHTTQLFRDVAAWYHIVVAFDSNLSQSNRVKIYVNGIQVTSFSTSTELSTSGYTTKGFNANSKNFVHGAYESSSLVNYYDGYLTEVNFVDGAAKAQTDFGEFDDNGVWIPKKYTGSYGTNGFFLQFKQTGTSANSSGIGADTSGNDNHFTPTNLAATDITEDTCTNNFATLNPLSSNNATLSEGNVEGIRTSGTFTAVSTIAPSSGKWYFEFKNTAAQNSAIGVVNLDDWPSTTNIYDYSAAAAVLIESNANYNVTYGNTASSPTTLQNSTDLVTAKYGLAMDIDNNDLYVSANGNWYGGSSFNQSDFSNATAVTTDLPSNVPLAFFVNGSLANTIYVNFGNPGGDDTISSGNTDGKYGNFEYAVPSGYYALCTKRLAEFG